MVAAARSARKGEQELARDKVLRVASDLFYRKGVRAIGVEEIVNRAGVAKISLYRGFPSKDALVVAYLEARSAEFWGEWDEAFSRYADDPQAQLRAIMRYLGERTTRPSYRGCPFLNFCCEFPHGTHPGRRVAEAAKRRMHQYFLAIARKLGVRRPDRLADALLLLAEGAYGMSQSLGGRNSPAKSIVWSAEALVDAHLTRRKP